MNVTYLTQKDQIAAAVILIATFCFILYWFVAQSQKLKDKFYAKHAFDKASRKHIFFIKYFGFLVLGLLPVLFLWMLIPGFSMRKIGLWFNYHTTWFSIVWTIGLSLVVIPMAFISAKKPENLKNYPQIRAKIWTNKTMAINLLGWALYLFGYELLFRGTLFFPLVDSLGIWPAIAINIALYACTHVPKGLAETLGAIPLGLVLCLLTLESGTVWIAFFVHLALAWTNSLTALAYHPEMEYTGRIFNKNANN
jgi:membrane protease YdiL (CAAX protease family)